jgi:hypothetical protein
MSNRPTRPACLALALGLLAGGLAVPGCGPKKGQRPTVPFTATVSYQGKPLDAKLNYHLVLTFYLQNDPEPLPSNPSVTLRARGGALENNGEFKASTYRTDDGLPEGTYTVSATLHRVKVQMGSERTYGDDLLGGRYSDAKTSPLEVVVKKGMEPVRLEVK